MPKSVFTTGQVAQLKEIESALVKSRGYGLHGEIQEIITRYTSGGVGTSSADPRITQAKVLWDFGWGREQGIATFEQYLETIPSCPKRPAGLPPHLDRLILWDLRPLLREEGTSPRVSLVKACRLLKVAFGGTDDTFVNHEATPEITEPVSWVWCQDGRRNRGKALRDCRKDFISPEVGLEAIGGLFLYAQDQTVIGGEGPERHVMDLPGSVRRGRPGDCAYLEHWKDKVRLYWRWHDSPVPTCGSGSRWGVQS